MSPGTGWGFLPPEVIEKRLGPYLRNSELLPHEWVQGWVRTLLSDSASQDVHLLDLGGRHRFIVLIPGTTAS